MYKELDNVPRNKKNYRKVWCLSIALLSAGTKRSSGQKRFLAGAWRCLPAQASDCRGDSVLGAGTWVVLMAWTGWPANPPGEGMGASRLGWDLPQWANCRQQTHPAVENWPALQADLDLTLEPQGPDRYISTASVLVQKVTQTYAEIDVSVHRKFHFEVKGKFQFRYHRTPQFWTRWTKLAAATSHGEAPRGKPLAWDSLVSR